MKQALRSGPTVKPWHAIAATLTVLAAPAFFVFEDLIAGIVLLVLGLAAAWYADRGGCDEACSIPLDAEDRSLRGSSDGATAASAASGETATAAETEANPAGRANSAGPASPAGRFAPGSTAGSARTPQYPRTPSLLRDIFLIALGLGIVRTIPLAAQLDNLSLVKFTLALGGAVAAPYLVSRFVFRDRAISFPWRGGGRWGRFHWGWLASVIVLGWLILPWYFISSGVFHNWPVVDSPELIGRLFLGVGAVGIWDELFFICTVFALLLRHFPVWLANVLQTVAFVSFLWELGYRAWGPLLTIPFALIQGMIFLRTRSLAYVVAVHLIFDAVVFAVLVHAHNSALFDIFPTAP